jgi:prepilin-type processing-associated H-X9-DG protein
MPRVKRGGFTLVHGLVVTAIIALAVALLIPTIQRAQAQASLVACKDNLRKIGVNLIEYARVNRGELPVSPTVENPHLELIDSLLAAHCTGDPKVYYCPSQAGPENIFSEEHFRAGVIGYYYYSALAASADPALSKFLRGGVSWPRELNTGMDPKTWVMSDIWVSGIPTSHAGYKKGVNYLMLDGSVGFVSESPRQGFH